MNRNAVVIVAAGRGQRLGTEDGPKQYRSLGNKSVLQHTIDCFAYHPDIQLVQVVIHKDDRDLYDNAIIPNDKLLEPVYGGSTRQVSCSAGVKALAGKADKVLIHDAARPFVSLAVIGNVLDGIMRGVCALPAIAVADTIKKVANATQEIETVDRDGLFLAQTPQGFIHYEILAAHLKAEEAGHSDFTDDAAVAEWYGMRVELVDGDRNNFKITTPDDLTAAREQISMANTFADIRTGSGYDTHILGPGDSVILCGVKIPHDQSLQGHSDADVGLHALTDALLGTIGAGDIGSHFPPTDPKWKGASSDQFLAHAVNEVRSSGGTITNLDVTIICEAPKIGPHRDSMRKEVARIAAIDDLSRVSIKATTNEKVGFIGRGEGIVAFATATVSFEGKPNV